MRAWSTAKSRCLKSGQVVKMGRSTSWRSVMSSSSTNRVQSSLDSIEFETKLPVRVEGEDSFLREVDEGLIGRKQTAAHALLIRDVLQDF